MQWLDHILGICLTFYLASKLLAEVAVPFYTPAHSE